MSWCRLWEEMPNDPKWRTIARVSKQRIGDVIAVFVHMMTIAAQSDERGTIDSWSDEDIASALDLDTEDVEAIRKAMQGRVLDGDRLKGWDRRQPVREDGSAERAKAWREKKKETANATERNRTQPNAQKRPDSDSDSDSEQTPQVCVLDNSSRAGAREAPGTTHTHDGGVVEISSEPPPDPPSRPEARPPVAQSPDAPSPATPPDTGHGIPADWEPDAGTVGILGSMRIPTEFAQACIPHFRLHHREAGTQRQGGFEALFVGWCKSDWAKQGQARAGQAPPPMRNGRPVYRNRQEARMTIVEWQQYLGEIHDDSPDPFAPLTLCDRNSPIEGEVIRGRAH